MCWPNIKRIDDADGNVAKFVFSNDTAVAEAVLYRYPDYKTRTVICCSTQSGCPIGCRFCGAGDHFVRNLTSDEIVKQVVHLLTQIDCDPNDIDRLQLMFMSMGEPMLNTGALIPALYRLHKMWPKAALLISTSAPDVDYSGIMFAANEIDTVGLQFSVHESTDEARDRLIPFKRKLTLSQIAAKGALFLFLTGRKPFFNYCANDGNSSGADADRIAVLFRPDVFEATVSVVCERNEGMPASNQRQRDLATGFVQKLVERGFNVRVFDPAGQDTIGGGCGQLWFVQEWMRGHPHLAKTTIGSGRPVVHAPALS